MMTIVLVFVVFVGGFVVGFAALFFGMRRAIMHPDATRYILKTAYRASHPHWLQRSDEEPRVCPCCGWSEQESLASGPVAPPTVRAEDGEIVG